MKKTLLWLARRFFEKHKISVLSIRRKLPGFVPNSGVDFNGHVNLTIAAANQVPGLLGDLSAETIRQKPEVTDIREIALDEEAEKRSASLGDIFVAHGSDKTEHGYHLLYGSLFNDPSSVTNVFEIGIGTPNPDVPSNMGPEGRPGASLRAFREFFPNASIFGADVDSRILFNEEKITTFALDQTDGASFTRIEKELPTSFDLIIDDGLHSPHANLRTLNFGLKKIRPGGWVVIEDIHVGAEEIWRAAWSILPANYEPKLFRASRTLVFAVQRRQ